ncbi:MAG: hypothetical protein CL433_11590 [Acidimicrobiaceae bacterium]|jgi:hypothetical protein|nr:hypothetical protein [Acidimicrobiaceae bacterium]HAB58650.1 hypothetical protein [Acidimicrobiaceae bacterium]
MKCTSRLVSSILSTACLLAIPLASVAAAQTQDGFRGVCTGAVDSLDKDGNVIDSAIYEGGAYPFDSAGEQVFTKDNPFLVAPGGRIAYGGEAANNNGDGPQNYEWSLDASVPFFGERELASGADANSDGTSAATGEIDLSELSALNALGQITFPLSFELQSENDVTCAANGAYVELAGSTAPSLAAGSALFVFGLVGLWRAKRYVSAASFGVAGSIGAAIAAIGNGSVDLSITSVVSAVAIGVVIGAAKTRLVPGTSS